MRSYGKIETGYWQNRKTKALSERGRLLMLYILTCPHGNSVGCFVLPDGYISADMQWSSELVSKHVTELVDQGLIERDEDTSLTRIFGWWGHNAIENVNVAKAALKSMRQLPRCEVFSNAVEALKQINNKFVNSLLNEFADVFDIPNLTEPNLTGTEPGAAPAGADISAEFDVWYAIYPKHVAKGQALKAYRAARKKVDAETLIRGAERYRGEPGRKPEFTKHPASWLNGECWADEHEKPAPEAQPEKPDPARAFRDMASMVAKGIRSQKTVITNADLGRMVAEQLVTEEQAKAYGWIKSGVQLADPGPIPDFLMRAG